jgi:hypothetical protein
MFRATELHFGHEGGKREIPGILAGVSLFQLLVVDPKRRMFLHEKQLVSQIQNSKKTTRFETRSR